MSLLLRKSAPFAVKASSRRRLVVSSCDSWVLLHQQSVWHGEARSPLGVTLSSLAASPRGEHDQDESSPRQHLHPVFPHGDHIHVRSTKLPFDRRLTLAGDGEDTSGASNSIARCSFPPASIRSRHSLIHLVAAERGARDLALRSLSTWATNNLFQISTTWNQRLRQLDGYHTVFFSTNTDGSRIRDPRLAKSGISVTKIPTPPSGPQQPSMKPEDVIEEINKKSKTVVLPALTSGLKAVLNFLLNLPKNLFFLMTHPIEIKEWWNRMKKIIKDEIDHYWVGTKLLLADLKTARNLLRRTLRGSSLTRRERKQLLRTISDLFRLVPFSMFLIIPLMEFALPFALKIFPNLLPSTFQDSLKAEENMKRELQSRIAMAKFFQETLEELAKEQKKSASHLKEEIKESGQQGNIDESVVARQEASAASFLNFMEKARSGEMIPNSVILDYAHYFKDDLTLDNMPRMQLINMCKYMGIAPYGSDSFLRFQLRHKMRLLQEDDQRILWEGIDSLTKMELREACQERGMRSTGLSKDAYKRALQQWLDLSVKQNVPTSLLIMSRTFFLREEMFENESDEGSKNLAGLADAISGLDKEVVNEVILNVATSQERMSDPGVRKIKLEVLMKQNELIEQEQAEREEAAAKKKEQANKEKKVAVVEMPSSSSSIDQSSQATSVDKQTDTANWRSSEGQSMAKNQPVGAFASDKAAKETKVDEDLSTAEMDAISHLVSADPVSRERADLESIKAALQDDKTSKVSESDIPDATEKRGQELRVGPESVQPEGAESLQSKGAGDRMELPTEVFTSSEFIEEANRESKSSLHEDPVVARLKKRIESMVDKIEVQLSDVQFKIGDKLHVLDKDMDGILSVEEIAVALQQVLKRKITNEEALVIAQQMDANKDGELTLQELIHWVEMNQLVKFVEEGRDHDMDRILGKQSAADSQEQLEEPSKSESMK